jgi:para-aminobenzoate synthetase component 1
MNKREFIRELNDLGKKSERFIFIIDFEFRNPQVFTISDAANNEVFFDIKDFTNWNYTESKKTFNGFKSIPVKRSQYLKSFDIVKANLLQGNTYLINLTFPTELDNKLELSEIFNCAKAPYKLLFKDQFTIFSPECFIRITDNKIFSNPMKGTIDASIENAREKILTDKKEQFEHNTIVDLIRNDISQVAENVKVTKFRYIDEILSNDKKFLQVSSEISGELPNNWNSSIGNLLDKLLPAGSISGAPKKKTIEIIKKAEKQKRGFYTGVFGFFDGKNLDCAVNIRYIEKKDGKFFFRSGGGITSLSDPEAEYLELINKVYVPLG